MASGEARDEGGMGKCMEGYREEARNGGLPDGEVRQAWGGVCSGKGEGRGLDGSRELGKMVPEL